MIGGGIDTLYFGYRPAARHAPECPVAEANMWETTRYTWQNFSGSKVETRIRLACHQCGAVVFLKFDQEESYEVSSAKHIGYGSAPIPVCGLWLHPGPSFHFSENGPTSYYVTARRDRLTDPGDVVGLVGWHLGKRGGVRWGASAGYTWHESYGTAKTAAPSDFASRRAAVAWVKGQLSPAGAPS